MSLVIPLGNNQFKKYIRKMNFLVQFEFWQKMKKSKNKSESTNMEN